MKVHFLKIVFVEMIELDEGITNLQLVYITTVESGIGLLRESLQKTVDLF